MTSTPWPCAPGSGAWACTSCIATAWHEGEWPPALLLGYALPTEPEIATGARLLAQAIG